MNDFLCPARWAAFVLPDIAPSSTDPANARAGAGDPHSPELQPPAEYVGLHGLALLGAEAKLRHQLRRVLQRVAVSQLTWRQGDTGKCYTSASKIPQFKGIIWSFSEPDVIQSPAIEEWLLFHFHT